MMCDLRIIMLVAFVAQLHAKEVSTNSSVHEQDVMDKLADNLVKSFFRGELAAQFVSFVDLDYMMLGKVGSLAHVRPSHVKDLTYIPRTVGKGIRYTGHRLSVSHASLNSQQPYDRPLLPSLVKEESTSYVLQEKLFSLSGEDFRVRDSAGSEVLQIDGTNMNLGGMVLDKLYFKDASGAKFCSVERRMLAASTCYDIYSADGTQLLAKVEREWLSEAPKYQFYYEGDLNPFADFYAEGSFANRAYTFKKGFGEAIARVTRNTELVKDLDTYEVEVAAGVDAAAILACAVIIDEDQDEEDAREANEPLKSQKPYDRPLLPSLVKEESRKYALQENLFSLSGEDFRVRDSAGNDVLQIDGANMNLGGVVLDKLYLKDASGEKFCSVERRMLAMSTCYDIYSADGKQLLAKVERDWGSDTPKYQFYYEGDLNPFPDFTAQGSFNDNTYMFKAGGDTIARVTRGTELVKDLDTYEVEVAAGVDAAAILACSIIIDEDHDEEDARRGK